MPYNYDCSKNKTMSLVDVLVIDWLPALLYVSFNCKTPDPNFGGHKNQELISKFSATPHQLSNKRHFIRKNY